MPAPADFLRQCNDLLARAEAAGFDLIENREIPYGRLFRFRQGAHAEAVLNCYHGKKGFRSVVAGKAADALSAALGVAPPAARSPGSADKGRGGADPFGLGTPRWGGDESGKGDYFGPLCVAVVAGDEAGVAYLREAGVADSKRLSDRRILELAGAIEARCACAVATLAPPDYNARYAEQGNLNHLLGGLYRDAVRELLASQSAPPVVFIDRFTTNLAALRGQLRLPRGVRLVLEPKAEQDPVVAAASILARAAYVQGLRDLEQEFGQDFSAGAGTPVLQGGRRFVRDFGADALAQVGKLHFKTTQTILGG